MPARSWSARTRWRSRRSGRSSMTAPSGRAGVGSASMRISADRHRAPRPRRQAARRAGLQADGRRAARKAPALLHDLSRPGAGPEHPRPDGARSAGSSTRRWRSGFRAVKMEVLFYDLVTDRELVGLIHEGRRMLGDDILMAVDFGYRWHNWHDALLRARPRRRLRHLLRRGDAAARRSRRPCAAGGDELDPDRRRGSGGHALGGA